MDEIGVFSDTNSHKLFLLNLVKYVWAQGNRSTQTPPTTILREISHHQKKEWDLWDLCESQKHPQSEICASPKNTHKVRSVWDCGSVGGIFFVNLSEILRKKLSL